MGLKKILLTSIYYATGRNILDQIERPDSELFERQILNTANDERAEVIAKEYHNANNQYALNLVRYYSARFIPLTCIIAGIFTYPISRGADQENKTYGPSLAYVGTAVGLYLLDALFFHGILPTIKKRREKKIERMLTSLEEE